MREALAKAKKTIMSAGGDAGPSPKELGELVTRVREALGNGRIKEAIESAKPILEKAPLFERMRCARPRSPSSASSIATRTSRRSSNRRKW